MSEKQTFLVERKKNDRWQDVARLAIAAIKEAVLSSRDFMVVIDEVKRTLDQNAAMWPALTDITRQVPWTVTSRDGSTRKATPYDWKDILTASFEEETEWTPGLRGGVVMLGARTSQYSKRKMADFLTFVRAEGNERGVVWSEKAKAKFDEYAPRQRAA